MTGLAGLPKSKVCRSENSLPDLIDKVVFYEPTVDIELSTNPYLNLHDRCKAGSSIRLRSLSLDSLVMLNDLSRMENLPDIPRKQQLCHTKMSSLRLRRGRSQESLNMPRVERKSQGECREGWHR